MQKIVLSESGATVEDVGFISWGLSSITNPFVGQPLTASQAGVFGAVTCATGVVAYKFWRDYREGKKESKLLSSLQVPRVGVPNGLQSDLASGSTFNSVYA